MENQKQNSQQVIKEPPVVNPGGKLPQVGVTLSSIGQNPPSPSVIEPQTKGMQQTDNPKPPFQPKKLFSKKLLLLIPFLFLFIIFIILLTRIKPGGLSSFGKKGEITWWGFWDESVVAPLIKEYEEANPGVKITYVTQSTRDYRDRLVSNLAKGAGPDIFRLHNTWVPMLSTELEPLPGSVLSTQEFNATYYPVVSSDLTVSSSIYAIPLGYDALTLYVNEDLLAQAGKQPPVTWDEFRILARDLTTKDRDGRIIQSGAAIGRTENIDHWQEILGLMLLQNGVNPKSPTGTLAADAVKFYTVFVLEDEIWDETLPASTVAFANGKVAMYFGPSSRASEISRMNPNLRYKTVPLPQLRKEDPNEPDVSYATYWAEGVWAKSANKEAAWDFLKFLSEPDSLETLFDNLSNNQIVGESYPRVDMRELLKDNKILSSITTLAPQAKSWYLADKTNDGPTGINTQINNLFKEVIDNVVSGRDAGRELGTIAPKISEILSQFGIK